MHELLDQLLDGMPLNEAEAEAALYTLAEDATPPALSGAFLAALRAKGETAAEVRGLARGMRAIALRPSLPAGLDAIDIVGTGGDHSGSFNLSTAAALLAGAAGCPVVKHGNRSISSKSGSADVLRELDVPIPDSPSAAMHLLATTGFTFLFAPNFHPAMKTIAAIRRAMGTRTVFNILGPLTNPAEPPFAVIGAFSQDAASLMADVLAENGFTRRAFVVHSTNGWDEATPAAPFHVYDVRPEHVTHQIRDPGALGLPRCGSGSLVGGDPATNAAAIRSVFDREPGPHRDAVVLGAALALEVAGDGSVSPGEAIDRARATIDDGTARRFLERLRSASRTINEVEHV